MIAVSALKKPFPHPAGYRRAIPLLVAVLAAMAATAANGQDEEELEEEPAVIRTEKQIIGATATFTEVSTGMPFAARIDTGAESCSLHVERIEIKDESERRLDNVGKSIRFMVRNQVGQEDWIETLIAGAVIIRNASEQTHRYKVRLALQWNDMKKEVLVTLTDRGDMKYPLLIGRNYLRGDFLVDVELDSDDQ